LKYKCDKCDRPATHHAVENHKGQKTEKHLCDEHAAEDGMSLHAAHAPINELLTNFIKMSGNTSGSAPADKKHTRKRPGRSCPDCGLRFAEFREKSILGCAGCYKAFERSLLPLLERAHEGGTQHVGKVPRRSGGGEQRQLLIARMRKRLDAAIAAENYELAAKLRDELAGLEDPPRKTPGKTTPATSPATPTEDPA